MRKATELPLGLPQQPHESLVSMQSCYGSTRRQPSGIHIALPVVTGYHSALPIYISSCQNGVRPVWIQFCQQ